MVTGRLSQQDAKEKGWLLDGYPRSLAQAQSLENMQIRPDIYIALDVCLYLLPTIVVVSIFILII